MKEGILASSCETETEYTAGCTVTKCFGEGLVSLSLSLALSLVIKIKQPAELAYRVAVLIDLMVTSFIHIASLSFSQIS